MSPYDLSPLWDNEDYWAMMRAVVDHPKERTPRYILADWLDERGFAAEALKHRINGAANSSGAVILEEGYVSLSHHLGPGFFKEFAKWHKPDATVVPMLDWKGTSLKQYQTIAGPVIYGINSQSPNPKHHYHEFHAIPFLYGVHARGPSLWPEICERLSLDFPEVRYFNLNTEIASLNDWELLKRLPMLETLIVECNAESDFGFVSYARRVKSATVNWGASQPKCWEALGQLNLECLKFFSTCEESRRNCFDIVTPLCDSLRQLIIYWISSPEALVNDPQMIELDLGRYHNLERMQIDGYYFGEILLPPNLKALKVGELSKLRSLAVTGRFDGLLELEYTGSHDRDFPILPNLRHLTVETLSTEAALDWVLSLPNLRCLRMSSRQHLPAAVESRFHELKKLSCVERA